MRSAKGKAPPWGRIGRLIRVSVLQAILIHRRGKNQFADGWLAFTAVLLLGEHVYVFSLYQ